MRRSALVVVFLLVVLAPVVAQDWEDGIAPPPIPGTGDLDWMAFVPRDWNVTTGRMPHTLDAVGPPREGRWPDVAFRIHGDIASIEGALVVPGPNGAPEPVYNAGVRFHAITFDPPLQLATGETLQRIFPGPLTWSNLTMSPDGTHAPERIIQTFAAVPRPGPGGASPPGANATGNETGIGLLLRYTLRGEPAPSNWSAVASPAIALIDVLLLLGGDAANAPTVSNLTFTFHFDFGGAAQAWISKGQGAVDATGFYLNRTRTYGTLRFAHNATIDNSTLPLRFASDAPADRHPANETARNLLSPLTLNVTAAGVPVPSAEGAQAQWLHLQGAFGYLAPTAPPPASPSPEPSQTSPTTTPAPAVIVLLGALLLAARQMRASPK